MGDRALVQFKNSKGELSPVCYLHNHAYQVSEFIRMTEALMQSRGEDLNYTFARFIGVCHEEIKGNLSLGVWNQETELIEADSHGDGGVLVVHCYGEWRVHCSGGYIEGYKIFARLCEVTGEGFNEGYCWGDGESYTKYKKDVVKQLRALEKILALELGFSDAAQLGDDNSMLDLAVNQADWLYYSDWSEDEDNFKLD